MSQPNLPPGAQPTNLQLTGGAAIVAPVTAFPSGVPGNALVVIPLNKPTEELIESIKKGPVVIDPDQMWKLLGFNGPAVQVQDNEGRPIMIGLEDLLSGLEKHWQENKDDLNRGRLYAQELMKHRRFDRAEKVMARVVANGGTGEDWLGLGVSQLQQEKWEDAEGTLKGAQNLLTDNPFPPLHLAKVCKGKGDAKAEREMIENAITIDPNCVDAWAYLFTQIRESESESAALKAIAELADAEPNKKSAAPFIAVQGFFAAKEETRDQAIEWAQKAVDRNGRDPLALISLSALYGQKGDLRKVVEVLQPAEPLMARDVRLANNYFEALFQLRELDKVRNLLNALAGSQNPQVKQFAVERSRAVAQMLQQQARQMAGVGGNRPQSKA